jgi:hypothetical protein
MGQPLFRDLTTRIFYAYQQNIRVINNDFVNLWWINPNAILEYSPNDFFTFASWKIYSPNLHIK